MKRYIAEGLSKYLKDSHGVWHMPGHKRKTAFPDYLYEDVDIQKLDEISDMIHTMDVTEVKGLDDLHNPQEMIKASEEELAKVYETFASYYLINGATCGIMSVIAACASAGDKVIVASNCHKSVHNVVELLRLEPVYINPEIVCVPENGMTGEDKSDKNYFHEIAGGILPEALDRLCRLNKTAKAVVITSPTYEGVFSDIAGISKIVHAYDMKLIVDEAHGAHLPFLDKLTEKEKKSSLYNGADLVIQSLHKTLPSMTQTAILHVLNESLDSEIKKYLSIFMSSSPSYVMLYDMERAVDIADNYNYGDYKKSLIEFRRKCKGFKNIELLCGDKSAENTLDIDDTRIVIFASKTLTGAGLERLLAEESGIVCEMSGLDYVVLISSFFDSPDDFDYLYAALKKIDDKYDYYLKKIFDIENFTNQVYTFNTNYASKAFIDKMIKRLEELEGTVAKDNIYVYPPGTYIVKKEEIYTKEIIDRLILYVKQGKQLHGEIF